MADSPSVTIEKGRYRMRAPLRPAPIPFNYKGLSRPRAQSTTRGIPSNMAAALIVLLAFACFASFSFAYYLFTTRWSLDSHRLRKPADEHPQVALFDSFLLSPREYPPSEKFLSYLPHSGLHNQRIALENAIILGALTNRTVLVPPIRLGTKPLRYVNSDSLQHIIATSGKPGLRHCAHIRSQFLPPECLDYFRYTHVSPAWLFNLTTLHAFPPLVFLDDLSSSPMREDLGLAPSEVLTLRDLTPYHYRFLDTNSDLATLKHKYTESIYIPDLAHDPHRLIEFGTLFGSSRLRLRVKENKQLRTRVRQCMDFSSPQLTETAEAVAKAFGGEYLGAHVRIGDGAFRKNSGTTLRQVWWKLVHDILQFDVSEALHFAHIFQVFPGVEEPPSAGNSSRPGFRLLDFSPGGIRCRSHRHSSSEMDRLNSPLFISTDIQNPTTDPSFAGFLRTFPCTFFLSDFPRQLDNLQQLQNEYDETVMRPFLLPLLDAMVVGRARVVAVTEGSTFSRFIEDVVWRRHWGLNIVERG